MPSPSPSPSPSPKKSYRSQQNYKEYNASKAKIVQDALEEARKSSSERGQRQHPPRTPTGLVIATSSSASNGPDTPCALGMNSPSTSEIGHMEQLLATTYDSRDNSGSTFGASNSINTSDDIIRKVEMEIATARKAATEAQLRLADALNKNWELQYQNSGMSENDHDSLGDLDIPLRDFLSLSSGEANNSPDISARQAKADRKVPGMKLSVDTRPEKESVDDGGESLKNIEIAVSRSGEGSNSDDDGTDPTDPTGSPTGSSSNESACLRYAGTQQTFESGVELPLEDVEANLAVVNTEDTHSSEEGSNGGSGSTPRSQALPDEFSDYTEETVTDDDHDGDVHSEYTEETVHSDDEVEDESEQGDADGSIDEEMTGDVDTPVIPNAAELSASPKPWIVGSRDMHKTPKEAKPWWAGGWWPDEEKLKKSGQIGDKQAGKDKESKDANENSSKDPGRNVLTLPACTCVDETGSVPTMSSREGGEGQSTEPTSPWSTAPDTENGESTIVDNGQSTDIENTFDTQTEDETGTEKGDASVPRDWVVSNVIVSPQDAGKEKNGSIKVQFRKPYPVPPQVAKPRPAPDIIADHTTGPPKRVAKWSKPKPVLDDLLAAVKGDSIHRRSNAIGALKVLLTKDVKNQVILVRTAGFLEALVFACSEDIQSSPEMEAAIIARNRAVTTIMKVCGPKENRILVMTEPGLPECLVKAVKEDTGEARAQACASLAMLAKTHKNREFMIRIDDLVNSLALVVKGTIDPQFSPVFNENEKSEIGALSLDDDATEASASTYGEQSSAVANLYSSDSIRKQKEDKRTEYELQAKINACAVLMHLAKHCSVSVSFVACLLSLLSWLLS